MAVNDEQLEPVMELIRSRTGICARGGHRDGIRKYIERRLDALNLSMQTYSARLMTNEREFSLLVNESTVNETYFFREEKQFAFIRDRVFPAWISERAGEPMRIWSAACAGGEEAYSLALLAKSCWIKSVVTASDINTDMLEKCGAGVYRPSSQRTGDGILFQHLLAPYRRSDGSVAFSDEIRSRVETRRINLAELDSPRARAAAPKGQNIVLLRNVFIYFEPQLRARILRAIAETCLADGGFLLVSMSEIAQIDSSSLPPGLERLMDGDVFYFHKKNAGGGRHGAHSI